ncbi:Transcription-repair coupling factor [Elusimicrobium minutum Pei191]|uniref:Transcription-repair-coupling factor n=1 Tax=Elusimicrobium minutum (strain Pei191) TaxID=445932 RepID=B2KBP0_ELUMP|nr:DEAD/DEAH box helicase [Elusimicrobium minutum]ACC97727.1 Transcription-repair coupling factor [Elusimicrobium minutum Pei191]
MTQKNNLAYFYGLPNFGAKARFVFDKFSSLDKNSVFVSNEEEDLDAFESALKTWSEGKILTEVYLSDDKGMLMHALYKILKSSAPLAITSTYQNLNIPLPGKKDFLSKLKNIKQTEVLKRGDLIDYLHSCGYKREEFTENPGEFAVRGSVVDVFIHGQKLPARLYFAGNIVETISSFDVDTQNTKEYKNEITVIPLHFEELPSNIKNWAGEAAFIFDNPASDFDATEYDNAVIISPIPHGENYALNANIKFNANMDLATKEINSLSLQGYDIAVFCLNRGEEDRLKELFNNHGILNKVSFKIADITQGYYSVKDKKAYITSSEILDRNYHTSSLLKNFEIEGAKRVRFKDLVEGDYIVHQTHGIGRYRGLETLDKDTAPTDALVIEYRKGSKLFVPVQDFGKVQKYIGVKGKTPPLSHLGGVAWKEVKRRVKEAAQKDAEEILKMEALRSAANAKPLTGDAQLEAEFADSFPYIQTPDQSQAISEILDDLTRQKTMDRVLVGDVGFGKTEVAMRAVMRTALSSKQVLVLVPTTILAAQHYKTFVKRMASFPVSVEMLSRFQTKAEQKIIVEKIRKGTVDIVVGTHRLLSKDISFANLGLVIIDEEHRFGVKQKEKIKAKTAGVHTLMLSATPIPRTLNQSLSSLRNLSLIETPPQGRMPVKTIVTPWNNDLAANAVRQEIGRGGQVYFVYNRVQSMESRLELLKRLVPEARICMAHGQMNETALEKTLWAFYNHEYDILLASTIIESGLDISNANTLIIESAQDFGLAQLYQLRGRIGRGDRKAYCYLFHPDWLFQKPKDNIERENNFEDLKAFLTKKKEADPTETAKKRLSALMEFSELGSGFKLALRDMEIRGAGELLGTRQHGFANEVGLSLYCDMVAAEVKKLKGEPVEKKYRATVNVPVAAYIPPEYLPDDNERLRYYKELLNSGELEQKKTLNKLIDLAGPLPEEVKTLSKVILISNKAGELNIRHIEATKDFVEFYFAKNFKMPEGAIGELIVKYGNNLKFIPSAKGDGFRINLTRGGANYFNEIENTLNFFNLKIK